MDNKKHGMTITGVEVLTPEAIAQDLKIKSCVEEELASIFCVQRETSYTNRNFTYAVVDIHAKISKILSKRDAEIERKARMDVLREVDRRALILAKSKMPGTTGSVERAYDGTQMGIDWGYKVAVAQLQFAEGNAGQEKSKTKDGDVLSSRPASSPSAVKSDIVWTPYLLAQACEQMVKDEKLCLDLGGIGFRTSTVVFEEAAKLLYERAEEERK
jgi:hypothetical protein